MFERTLLLAWTLVAVLVAGCSHSPEGRLARGERLVGEVDTLLTQAERHMRALHPDEAEEKLEDARELLAHEDLMSHPDAQLQVERHRELAGRLERVRKEKSERELELAVEAQRQQLERARTRLLQVVDALNRPGIEDGNIRDVTRAMEEVEKRLRDGVEFERKSVSYADDANYLRRSLDRTKPMIALAERRLDFRRGPADAWIRGAALLERSRVEKDPAEKKETLTRARQLLSTCTAEGGRLLEANPELKSSELLLDGKKHQVATVLASCQRQGAAAEKTLVSLAKAEKKRQSAQMKKKAATARKRAVRR